VTRLTGGKTVKVSLSSYQIDLDSILEATTLKTKMVFICNPNNPTGSMLEKSEIERFLSAIPSQVIVVFDEAYGDFVDDPAYPDTIKLIESWPNVVLMKTFSKIYGLAGLRLGYAVAQPELISYLKRVREPFAVNRLAQAAGVAALEDKEFFEESRDLVLKGRQYFYDQLKELDLPFVPSQANFVFFETRQDSLALFHELLKEGFIVRPGNLWGTPNHIRVSIGLPEDNTGFFQALKRVLARLGG
jgi:histidinol-phosphate aminotransferase